MTKHTAANLADGLFVWKPPNRATASVAVQSRWGKLGLAWSRARRPPNAARQPVRTIRLLVEATVTGECGHQPASPAGDFD